MAISLLGAQIVILTIVFTVLPIVAVGLRIWARFLLGTKHGPDDYLIFPALVFAVGLNANVLVGAALGNLGGHTLPGPDGLPVLDETLTVFLKTEFASELLPILCMCFSKLSIVFFYRRVFRGRAFDVVCWALVAIIIAFSISFFCATLFQCHPISAVWKTFYGQSGRSCYDYGPMFRATVVCNMLIDVMIFTTPMPMIWQLQMPVRLKAAVSAVFLMGALVTATSIVRIYYYFRLTNSYGKSVDITYLAAPAVYWTQLESSTAVICACLPTLKPLANRIPVESALRSWASKLSVSSVGSRSSKRASTEAKASANTFLESSSLENLAGTGGRVDIKADPLQKLDSDRLDSKGGIKVETTFSGYSQRSSFQTPNAEERK